MARRTRALTLIEGIIITGIFILLSIMIIPFMKGARICANEQEAVEVLRELYKSIFSPTQEEAKTRLSEIIKPITRNLPDVKVIDRAGTEPFISHHGYLFRLGLDQEDDFFSGCIIAWPKEIDDSGTAAFFIDEQGELSYTHNLQRRYSGTRIHPRLDAARPKRGKEQVRRKAAADNKEETNSYIGVDGERWAPLILQGTMQD